MIFTSKGKTSNQHQKNQKIGNQTNQTKKQQQKTKYTIKQQTIQYNSPLQQQQQQYQQSQSKSIEKSKQQLQSIILKQQSSKKQKPPKNNSKQFELNPQSNQQHLKQYQTYLKQIQIDSSQLHKLLLSQNIQYFSQKKNNYSNYQNKPQNYKHVHIEQVKYSSNYQIIQFYVFLGDFKIPITILNMKNSCSSNKNQQNIPIHNINSNQKKKIGQGSFSSIYAFQQQLSLQKIAIKCSSCQSFIQQISPLNQNPQKSAYQLAIYSTIQQYCYYKIFSALNIGPKIYKRRGFDLILYKQCIQFQMEFCQQSSVQLTSGKKIDQLKQDLFKSLKIMHNFNIVHLDIKPDNILYSTKRKKFIFADYGSTKQIYQNLGFKTHTKFTGTICYVSPDMNNTMSYKSGFVDLYHNDLYCLLKSIKQIQKAEKYKIISSTTDSDIEHMPKYYHLAKIKFAIFTKKIEILQNEEIKIGQYYFQQKIIQFILQIKLDQNQTKNVKQIFKIQQKLNVNSRDKYNIQIEAKKYQYSNKPNHFFKERVMTIAHIFNKIKKKIKDQKISTIFLINQIKTFLLNLDSFFKEVKNKNDKQAHDTFILEVCNYYLLFLIQQPHAVSLKEKFQISQLLLIFIGKVITFTKNDKFQRLSFEVNNQQYMKKSFYPLSQNQNKIRYTNYNFKDQLISYEIQNPIYTKQVSKILQVFFQTVNIITQINTNLYEKKNYFLNNSIDEKLTYLYLFLLPKSSNYALVSQYLIFTKHYQCGKINQMIQALAAILVLIVFRATVLNYAELFTDLISKLTNVKKKFDQNETLKNQNYVLYSCVFLALKFIEYAFQLVQCNKQMYFIQWTSQSKPVQQKKRILQNFQKIYAMHKQNASLILQYCYHLLVMRSSFYFQNKLRQNDFVLLSDSFNRLNESLQTYLMKIFNYGYYKISLQYHQRKLSSYQKIYTVFKNIQKLYLIPQVSFQQHKQYLIEKILFKKKKQQIVHIFQKYCQFYIQYMSSKQPIQLKLPIYEFALDNINFYIKLVKFLVKQKTPQFQKDTYNRMIKPIEKCLQSFFFKLFPFLFNKITYAKNQIKKKFLTNFGSLGKLNSIFDFLSIQKSLFYIQMFQVTQKSLILNKSEFKQYFYQDEVQQKRYKSEIYSSLLQKQMVYMQKFNQQKKNIDQMKQICRKAISYFQQVILQWKLRFKETKQSKNYEQKYQFILNHCQYIYVIKTLKQLEELNQQKFQSKIQNFNYLIKWSSKSITQMLLSLYQKQSELGLFYFGHSAFLINIIQQLLVEEQLQYYFKLIKIIFTYYKKSCQYNLYSQLIILILRCKKKIKSNIIKYFKQNKKTNQTIKIILNNYKINDYQELNKYKKKHKNKYIINYQLFPLKFHILQSLYYQLGNQLFEIQQVNEYLKQMIISFKYLTYPAIIFIKYQFYYFIKEKRKIKDRKYFYLLKQSKGCIKKDRSELIKKINCRKIDMIRQNKIRLFLILTKKINRFFFAINQ